MPRRTRWVLGALVFALGGCEGASAPAPLGPSERDSAGIRIVENAAQEAPDGFWRVGEAPLLDLGALDGPAAYQFYRVQDAHRRADGTLWVANGGSGEVRVFDETGAYLHAFGSAGEGPGEFRQIGKIFPWSGDSLAVWDRQLARVTFFGPPGTLPRTLPLTAGEGAPPPNDLVVLPDGRLVATTIRLSFDRPTDAPQRAPVSASVLASQGRASVTLDSLPGREIVVRIRPESVNVISVPFARDVLLAAVGDRVLFSTTDGWTLRMYSTPGALEGLVRVKRATRAVREADLVADQERRLARAPEEARDGLRASFAFVPPPDSMPAMARAVTDALGLLWIQEYRPPAEHGPEVWSVFTPEGRLLGRVQTPEGLTVYWIGEHHLLGRADDELGVEHVQLWALQRDGPA